MNRKRITIAEVAAAAGVSMMTVSRAINQRDGINEKTRQRILKIAAEMGYRPSQLARGLVTHQSATLGLVMPDVANPFFAQIARGAEDVAYQYGYNLFLINTAEDAEREKRALNSLLEKEIDGAVLCSSRLSRQEVEPYLDTLPAVVLVNRELDQSRPWVTTLNVDDRLGAKIAVEYLIKNGHKQIAFAAGPKHSISSQRRLEGYKLGLQENARNIREDFVEYCSPDTAGGDSAAQALFLRHPNLDAVIAFNDLVAIGVLNACVKTNRQVPRDVAIIGADDIPMASLTNPSLTTLHVDLTAVGTTAMHTLLQMIDNPKESIEKIVIKPELLIRQSS